MKWNCKFHGGGESLNWAVEPKEKKKEIGRKIIII
jgi:hypothetical protein